MPFNKGWRVWSGWWWSEVAGVQRGGWGTSPLQTDSRWRWGVLEMRVVREGAADEYVQPGVRRCILEGAAEAGAGMFGERTLT